MLAGSLCAPAPLTDSNNFADEGAAELPISSHTDKSPVGIKEQRLILLDFRKNVCILAAVE